jgi:hypothetical protein
VEDFTQGEGGGAMKNFDRIAKGVILGLFVLTVAGILWYGDYLEEKRNNEAVNQILQQEKKDIIYRNDGTADTLCKPLSELPPALIYSWIYEESEDKMGSKVKTAQIQANEKLYFSSPYEGGSFATLTLRKKGRQTDVYFQVSQGQIIVDSSGGTKCRVRFDQQAPQTFYLDPPSDYSSETVFLRPVSSFIKQLKKSKKVVLEIIFHDEGSHQIEFNVSDLKWQ